MEDSKTVRGFLMDVSELVTERGVQYVCAKRSLEPDDCLSCLDERSKDLAEGTVYYWLSSLPVGGNTEKVSDGGWSHSKGGWQVSKTNIDEWKSRYRDLYNKWDEPLLGNSKIRILNF